MADDDADGDASGAGLGTIIGAGVVSFVLLVPVAIYLLAFNATQAVLIGGLSGTVSAYAAYRTGKKQASD